MSEPADVELVEALARACASLVKDVPSVRMEALPEGAGWSLEPAGGQPIALIADARGLELAFAGWTERIDVRRGDAADPEAEAVDDALALALDFAAAALFGELRVIEARVGDALLARALEVRVDAGWMIHARRGALGLRGLVARLRGRLARTTRSNEGRVARPRRLRDAGPSGLASAPWSGAAGALTDEPSPLAIDGELDLHNFSPKEVGRLVREYIEVCHARGIVELRIIHGKGKGVLRRTVHAILDRHPAVASYRLGGHGEGSWGATMVVLTPRAGPKERA